MNNKCNIVKDLAPLYAEDMVSEDTRVFVEEHLGNCARCRLELEQFRKSAKFVPDMDVAPLKKLKEKLLVKRIQTIFFTAVLVFAILTSVFAIMTSPRFFPYSEDLIQITENQAGTVMVTFADKITGYSCLKSRDKDTGTELYHIDAWNTIWDKNFSNRGKQNIVINPTSRAGIKIYYVQNNGNEDVPIYGLNDDAGSVTLPRLVLKQYFLLILLLFMVLLFIRYFVRRQETLKMWLNRILLFPVSYMAAHFFTKGLSFTSYSTQRDFGFIILGAILLYCAALSGISLYQAKKRGA